MQPEKVNALSGLSSCAKWWREIQEFPNQRDAIREVGFSYLFGALEKGLKSFSVGALTALVERWGETTHTFHLPMGELTITPSDVVAITGLPWTDRTIHFDTYLDCFHGY